MDSTLEQSPAATVMQLTWQQRDGNLVVTPSDQDRFMVKVGKAIEILRLHQRVEQFSNQFNLLLKRLARWLEDHAANWERAFLTAGESTLRFIVVRKRVRFDEEITDALSDLGVGCQTAAEGVQGTFLIANRDPRTLAVDPSIHQAPLT